MKSFKNLSLGGIFMGLTLMALASCSKEQTYQQVDEKNNITQVMKTTGFNTIKISCEKFTCANNTECELQEATSSMGIPCSECSCEGCALIYEEKGNIISEDPDRITEINDNYPYSWDVFKDDLANDLGITDYTVTSIEIIVNHDNIVNGKPEYFVSFNFVNNVSKVNSNMFYAMDNPVIGEDGVSKAELKLKYHCNPPCDSDCKVRYLHTGAAGDVECSCPSCEMTIQEIQTHN